MIAVPCKEPVAGERTEVMVDFIGTSDVVCYVI